MRSCWKFRRRKGSSRRRASASVFISGQDTSLPEGRQYRACRSFQYSSSGENTYAWRPAHSFRECIARHIHYPKCPLFLRSVCTDQFALGGTLFQFRVQSWFEFGSRCWRRYRLGGCLVDLPSVTKRPFTAMRAVPPLPRPPPS